MTAVDKYILAIKNYKNIGGSIDDAIVIADTLLKEGVDREKQSLYTEEQVREAIEDARDILSHVNTDEVIKSLKQSKKD